MRKSSLCTQNGYRVNIRLQELTLCLTLYSCYDSFFPLQGSRQESWPDSQGDQASSTGDALPLGEQQDLHYASLSFHGIKPQELQDMKATSTTEYSEIKINKWGLTPCSVLVGSFTSCLRERRWINHGSTMSPCDNCCESVSRWSRKKGTDGLEKLELKPRLQHC
jgi:hypothetical protein